MCSQGVCNLHIRHVDGSVAIQRCSVHGCRLLISLPWMMDLGTSLVEFTRGVTENLSQIYAHIDLIMMGVNLALYRRFRALTPFVTLTIAKTIYCTWGFGTPSHFSKEDAEFCINFVIDSTLQIRDNSRPDWNSRNADQTDQPVVVEHDCDLIVYPTQDSPEVIRTASAGERLSLVSSHFLGESSGYVTVLQDGEPAYARSDCIRSLSAGSEHP